MNKRLLSITSGVIVTGTISGILVGMALTDNSDMPHYESTSVETKISPPEEASHFSEKQREVALQQEDNVISETSSYPAITANASIQQNDLIENANNEAVKVEPIAPVVPTEENIGRLFIDTKEEEKAPIALIPDFAQQNIDTPSEPPETIIEESSENSEKQEAVAEKEIQPINTDSEVTEAIEEIIQELPELKTEQTFAQAVPNDTENVSAEGWRQLAIDFDENLVQGKPMIAIIIDDVGVAQKHSREATDLPAPMTMAIIPYGRDLKSHAENALRNGHELMLHLPMEPSNPNVDPGENALLVDLSDEELQERILWNFNQFSGFMAVNNHMGSKFSAHSAKMRLVIEAIQKRNLAYIDSVTTPQTVGYKMASDYGVATARRNYFLDHVQTEEFISDQLRKTEAFALENGYAIAIGHPHDKTMAVLRQWAADVQERGFVLVPASMILKKLNPPLRHVTEAG